LLRVSCLERLGYLNCEAPCVRKWERSGLLAGHDRPALDEFHDQVVRSDIVQRANGGMIERGDCAGFFHQSRIVLSGEALYGYDATEGRVTGLAYLSHATGADEREDLVWAEFVACHQGHRI
jgi:hypothetical protein